MAMKPGSFAWYDLMTSDTAAAAKFYRDVIGWTSTDVSIGDNQYAVFAVGPANVGGLMPLTEQARADGIPPCWTGYILVDDVDGYTGRVKAAGGKVLREPVDVPGMLRFSVVSDPHGAVFILFKGKSSAPPVEIASDAVGNIGWHELHAGDGASAFEFYSTLFGWNKTSAFDMGPMGTYQLFATGGEAAVGGMMTKRPDAPNAFWLYYINVDGIDAAVARVTKAGGKVCMGPHQVPTGQWIAVCNDPQGAWFAMLSPGR